MRLRLPHVGDRAEVRAFLGRLGLSVGELELRRGLRVAPPEQWSVVATRWDGHAERVVGMATVDERDGTPTLLAEDAAVVDLLAQALAEHAGATRAA